AIDSSQSSAGILLVCRAAKLGVGPGGLGGWTGFFATLLSSPSAASLPPAHAEASLQLKDALPGGAMRHAEAARGSHEGAEVGACSPQLCSAFVEGHLAIGELECDVHTRAEAD